MANGNSYSPKISRSFSSATERLGNIIAQDHLPIPSHSKHSRWDQLYRKIVAATMTFRRDDAYLSSMARTADHRSSTVISVKEPESIAAMDNWSTRSTNDQETSSPRLRWDSYDQSMMGGGDENHDSCYEQPSQTQCSRPSPKLFHRFRCPGRTAHLDLTDPNSCGLELSPTSTALAGTQNAGYHDEYRARHDYTIEALSNPAFSSVVCCLNAREECRIHGDQNVCLPLTEDHDHGDSPGEPDADADVNVDVNADVYIEEYPEETQNQQATSWSSNPVMLIPEYALRSSTILPSGTWDAFPNQPSPEVDADPERESIAETLVNPPGIEQTASSNSFNALAVETATTEAPLILHHTQHEPSPERGRPRHRRHSASRATNIYTAGCTSLQLNIHPTSIAESNLQAVAATRPNFLRSLSAIAIRQYPLYDEKATKGYATTDDYSTCHLVLPASAAVELGHINTAGSDGTAIRARASSIANTTHVAASQSRQRRGAVDHSHPELTSNDGAAISSALLSRTTDCAVYMSGGRGPVFSKKARIVNGIVGVISDWRFWIQHGRERRWKKSDEELCRVQTILNHMVTIDHAIAAAPNVNIVAVGGGVTEADTCGNEVVSSAMHL